jgi:hypothetical protein
MAYLSIINSVISSTQVLRIPQGVYSLTVLCIGGGGGGSIGVGAALPGGGGGGGAFAQTANIPVIPEKDYTFTVGAGVVGNTSGNFTQFIGENGVTCKAAGGLCVAGSLTGGAGGTVANSIGDAGFVFAGGNGATEIALTNRGGGGGGGGACSSGTGNNGTATISTAGGLGGAFKIGTGINGGKGGSGGSAGNPGLPGSSTGGFGGGGGGSSRSVLAGGNGGAGAMYVIHDTVSYTSYTGAGYAGGMAF